MDKPVGGRRKGKMKKKRKRRKKSWMKKQKRGILRDIEQVLRVWWAMAG